MATQEPPKPAKTLELRDGEVQPIVLGVPGARVKVGHRHYTVSAAVPGDKVQIEPIHHKGDTPPARLRQLVSAGPDRVQAPCTLLNRCGACTWQAQSYTSQLEDKHKALVNALGGLCSANIIAPIKGLRSPFGYRTRLLAQAAPKTGKSRGLRMGFYQRGTMEVVATGGCPVQHPLTLAMLVMVEQVLAASPVRATTIKSPNGWLHGINIRVDPQSGATELTLMGRTHKVPGGQNVIDRLAALPGVSGLHLSINPKRSSYLNDGDIKRLHGKRRTGFHLGGQVFNVSPGAFFQTSIQGAELLAETVLDMMPERFDTLTDLYGGVGIFARLSHERWRRAVVVESNPNSIEDLKHDLSRSDTPGRIKALAGKVEEMVDQLHEPAPDVVVIDPPRSGCHPRVIGHLTDQRPPVIIYVACGIDALKRDGAALLEGGYRIDRVEAVDMFPHTSHLETVARFVAI